jgi:hypothetical protein
MTGHLTADQATEHARAVWLLSVLAKQIQLRPDGSGVLVLSTKAVLAVSAYSPEADAARPAGEVA